MSIRCLILVGCLALCLGCGSSGPRTFTVQGNVTWEGKPIPDGRITFLSLDPTVVDDEGVIANGSYLFQAKAGQKKVVIHATREEGEIDPVMGQRPQVAYIPVEYSSSAETKLTAEVTAGGKNNFDFNLPIQP